MHPVDIALSGISGCAAVSSFCAMVMPPALFMPHSAAAPVAVIAGDNDSDEFAVPVLGNGAQKNGDDVRPSPWL